MAQRRIASLLIGIALSTFCGPLFAAPASPPPPAATVLLFDGTQTIIYSYPSFDAFATYGPVDVRAYKVVQLVVSVTGCDSENFAAWVTVDGVVRDSFSPAGPVPTFQGAPTPQGTTVASKTYDNVGLSMSIKLRSLAGNYDCQGRVQVYGGN